MTNFVTGANEKDAHLLHVNMGRDFQISQLVDLRKFTQGDLCPLWRRRNENADRGIEVGHILKLGTKYSKAMARPTR